jgi:hypothetical protein
MTENFQMEDGMLVIRLPMRAVERMVDGQPIPMLELGIELPFARKPADLSDFGCGAPQRVLVHKHQQLEAAEFDRFASRLCARTAWLEGEALAVDDPRTHCCVMVTAPGRPILFVDTQGYGYARYVARLA